MSTTTLTPEQEKEANEILEGAKQLAASRDKSEEVKKKIQEISSDNDDTEKKESDMEKAERWYQEDKEKYEQKLDKISERNPGGDFVKYWTELMEKVWLAIQTPREERKDMFNEIKSWIRQHSDPKLIEERKLETNETYEEKHERKDKEKGETPSMSRQ